MSYVFGRSINSLVKRKVFYKKNSKTFNILKFKPSAQ